MQLYILCSTCSIFDDAGDYKFDAKLKASAGKVKKGSYFNEPDAMDKEVCILRCSPLVSCSQACCANSG